jgi:UDP-glucose 4-epimerase
MKLLVTGANGFVGRALVSQFIDRGRTVVGTVRHDSRDLPPRVARIVVGDLASDTDWRAALAGIDVVIHLAARVHVMRDSVDDPLTEFRRVNVEGTRRLARQASATGVSRFVFLSSVKVNGESGVYRESDVPAPNDAYGMSKREAELSLAEIAAETGMSVVVIRPPLVYGPGVRANFRALMLAVARGVPLPFGAIDNRRSLVALDNLVDFIIRCVEDPAAANETFLVSDGEDLSTPELIRRLARAMGRRAWLVPVPVRVLTAVAGLVNRRDAAQRLLGSLQVDISKARRVLAWAPPITVDEGLRRAAAAL